MLLRDLASPASNAGSSRAPSTSKPERRRAASPVWTLENRAAIVTGGSRGIGLAIAEALLARGARVVISGTNASHLEAALARLSAPGRWVEGVRADVRLPEQVGALVSKTVETFGGLDILVNNAGIGRFVEASDMTIDEWRGTIETNLSGVFYCCSAAIPHLKKSGGGWIINVSSLAGKDSFPGGTAYCASKAGLNAFSEALMQEVRYDGIRVCYVMPGSVSTEFGGPPRGEDKALKPFLGRPLIQRVVERLSPIADELIVTTNHTEDYRFLDLRLFPDLKPGRGALGGLYTAIASATHPFVAVVACDMPFASTKLIEAMTSLMVEKDADVVIAKSDEGYEPIHAVYRRVTCLPAIESAIHADQWKVIAWFPQVKVHTLTLDDVKLYDPSGLAFWNVNTPEEFAEAEGLARLSG